MFRYITTEQKIDSIIKNNNTLEITFNKHLVEKYPITLYLRRSFTHNVINKEIIPNILKVFEDDVNAKLVYIKFNEDVFLHYSLNMCIDDIIRYCITSIGKDNLKNLE